MRRILFLLFTVVSMYCQAQHFSFMGVPIDGKIMDFDTKIKEKGFVTSRAFGTLNSATKMWYEGKFAGNNVQMFTMATPKSGTVFAVGVTRFFQNRKDAVEWAELYKKGIEKKYKIKKKSNSDATHTSYLTSNGDIIVGYASKGNTYRLDVYYYDLENTSKYKKEEKEIDNDL